MNKQSPTKLTPRPASFTHLKKAASPLRPPIHTSRNSKVCYQATKEKLLTELSKPILSARKGSLSKIRPPTRIQPPKITSPPPSLKQSEAEIGSSHLSKPSTQRRSRKERKIQKSTNRSEAVPQPRVPAIDLDKVRNFKSIFDTRIPTSGSLSGARITFGAQKESVEEKQRDVGKGILVVPKKLIQFNPNSKATDREQLRQNPTKYLRVVSKRYLGKTKSQAGARNTEAKPKVAPINKLQPVRPLQIFSGRQLSVGGEASSSLDSLKSKSPPRPNSFFAEPPKAVQIKFINLVEAMDGPQEEEGGVASDIGSFSQDSAMEVDGQLNTPRFDLPLEASIQDEKTEFQAQNYISSKIETCEKDHPDLRKFNATAVKTVSWKRLQNISPPKPFHSGIKEFNPGKFGPEFTVKRGGIQETLKEVLKDSAIKNPYVASNCSSARPKSKDSCGTLSSFLEKLELKRTEQREIKQSLFKPDQATENLTYSYPSIGKELSDPPPTATPKDLSELPSVPGELSEDKISYVSPDKISVKIEKVFGQVELGADFTLKLQRCESGSSSEECVLRDLNDLGSKANARVALQEFNYKQKKVKARAKFRQADKENWI